MTLLPSNATQLERLAAEGLAEIQRVPIRIRELHDPYKCGEDLLPYLAWARSVDRWDESWAVEVKRSVIANSYYVHAHKGTIGALRRVVEPLGYIIRVTEWFKESPAAEPGTFKLDIGVLESGITDEMYSAMSLFIDDAKPASRHLSGLAINLESKGKIFLAAGLLEGEILTVYPWLPETIEVASVMYGGATIHTIDTMSVNP